MDLETLMRDAALFGLAVGVVAMAGFILYAYGHYLLRPTISVAAATTSVVPFGFQVNR